eukprot:m.226228 g.226228  ORF g.226228 m.226228 type:complete len:61 (-) comp33487_c0_seq5:550-732(-)
MGLADLAQRGFAVGLIGLTVYYGAFLTVRGNQIVTKKSEERAAKKALVEGSVGDGPLQHK